MISVIVPAYNEADAIQRSVETIRDVLNRGGLTGAEIIVIDDGSSDGTGNIALEAGAIVVRQPHNLGYGSALKAGIARATNDTIVIIDADLTYPVEAIPDLVARYREGFDMVVGARSGEHYRESIIKSPLRRLLKAMVEFTAERPVPDVNSGLRVFGKARVTEYLGHLCNTFSFTTSLTLAYMMTGRFVTYVPIAYTERVGQSKVRLFKDAVRTFQYVVQSMIYYNPLRMFILMSVFCVLMAVASFAVGALSDFNAPYYLGIGGLLMALLVFSIGLLADLLRQIMARGQR